MITSLFQDRRTTGLLSRVREDVSHLREDIGNLLSHTTRRTLPNGARELADQARHQLSAGGTFAASKLRDLRSHPPTPSASVVGGAVVLGLLALGAYAIFRNSSQAAHPADEIQDELEGLS
jgi:hypothetical protein